VPNASHFYWFHKIGLSIDRSGAFMFKPKVEIWLELETRCNLNCKFCYNYWKDGVTPAPHRLGTNEMLEALHKLFRVVECDKIAISGGEPLLREDLFKILAVIKGYEVRMVLASNAILLDQQRILKLMTAGIETFQPPLHSTSEQLHDMLSGVPCWRKTIRSLVTLKQLGANVVPVFVATKLNLYELGGVVELCFLLGIQEMIVNRFVPGGLGLRNERLLGVPSDFDMIRVLSMVNARARQLNVLIHLGVPIALGESGFDRISRSTCPVAVAQTKWTVDCGGNIRRCNHSGTAIGNLMDDGAEKLLQEIGQQKENEGSGIYRQCQFLCHNVGKA
jgi:MoaA/NifB/PqqE/SkfB family radical SAM enzyme